MITIRSTRNISEPTLIGFQAELTTPSTVYEFSSAGPMIDSITPIGGSLFGNISWPQARFRIEPGVTLEQHVFISHDTSDVAISWELKGRPIPVRLAVRPYFAGCGARGYRDIGFHFESNKEGSRQLVWLPTVRGPRVIADTNGRYADEPLWSTVDVMRASRGNEAESLVAPGRFEFELSHHPSVLILSQEGHTSTERHQLIGSFLANLMERTTRCAGVEDDPVAAAA